jgi:hypothetical protein
LSSSRWTTCFVDVVSVVKSRNLHGRICNLDEGDSSADGGVAALADEQRGDSG